ncbi:GreA/GreB family elongation factor [Sphingomonas sp.]|jgi:transcription elongation GreA/GreB family factor|uniref:GreA/GreB family elongation factor n=1 Tax=Sphingomonas sp. TaxID=28214 RepID=UPI00262C8885|nr:GreA/GreB family elongation factor [Sphingomonas sp.]MDF2494176.1 nucleoside-diphosphate kinase [Sphingomonas sp.]
MSVAFRRESDEEHLEPRFELPLPKGPNLVTERGLALINERIAALTDEQAGAEEPRASEIARELRYWNTRRVTAVVAPRPPADEVAFGSRVRFRLNGKEQEIVIVGDDEADPAAGKIAFSAPLVRALLGGAADEVVPFNGRDDAITILDVRPD